MRVRKTILAALAVVFFLPWPWTAQADYEALSVYGGPVWLGEDKGPAGFTGAVELNFPFIPPLGVTMLQIRQEESFVANYSDDADFDGHLATDTQAGFRLVHMAPPIPFIDHFLPESVFIRLGLGVGTLDTETEVKVRSLNIKTTFEQSHPATEKFIKAGYNLDLDMLGINRLGLHAGYHHIDSSNVRIPGTEKEIDIAEDAYSLGLLFQFGL